MKIDWSAVEAMMQRGKRGRARDGDRELAQLAYTADPIRYSALKQLVDSIVHDEMRKPMGSK